MVKKSEFDSVGETFCTIVYESMSTLYDSFDDGGLFHFNRGSHVPVVCRPTCVCIADPVRMH